MSTRNAAQVRFRAATALVAATVLGAALLLAPPAAVADTAPPSGSGLPATVSADALPTVQQNGVVWAQVLVGNTVYATGRFTETWPAGQSESNSTQTARANLLAYNITTGDLVTSFSHELNAQGLGIAASPDGSTVYVVGDFTQVDGKTHNHIVAFNTADGSVQTSFKASITGETRAVAATSSTVYVGGTFTQAGGTARTRLAAFTAAGGALTTWAPTADNQVDALALTTDGSRVLVGGRFVQLDGTDAYGLGSIDANDATLQPFALNGIIQDAAASAKCGITSLTVSGDTVYGTGFAYGCGDFEGRFAADALTGKPIWIDDCHGDSYGTVPVGQVLYSVSHAHDCSAIGSFPDKSPPANNQRALAETTYATGTNTGPDAYGWNYAGQPDATILQWFPKLAPGTVTNQNQAAWSIVGNSSYLALGGEFPSVNGVAQAGLVRFAVSSVAPNKQGPLPSSGLTPTAASTSSGIVNLSWKATWDEDNADLTYTVKRKSNSGSTVTSVGTLHESSTFWQLPTMTFTDTGLTPGGTYQYYVSVADPLHNSIGSATSASVTVSDSGNPPPASGPQASFTSSCSQATCSFDASGSRDQSGTAIASYRWDFGDGSTTSGATVSHTYATSGKHVVTLTVENANGENSVSQPVTTSPPPAKLVALDTFRRTMSSGWGDADQGGVWQPVSGCGPLSVRRQTGYVVAKRTQGCSIGLSAVSRESTDSTTGMTTTKLPKGGIYLSVLGRRLSADDDVRLQLHVLPTGHVQAELVARAGKTTTVLGKAVTLAVKYTPQTRLMMRLQVNGTKPTVVRAKVWTGTTQPSSWLLSGQTSLAALQHKGSVGFAAYLPKAKNAATCTVRVSELTTTLVAT